MLIGYRTPCVYCFWQPDVQQILMHCSSLPLCVISTTSNLLLYAQHLWCASSSRAVRIVMSAI